MLYFGVLKEFFGGEKEAVEMTEESSVEELLGMLRDRSREAPPVWGAMAVAVNREYAALSTVLREGDEVALLPPVSGGVR